MTEQTRQHNRKSVSFCLVEKNEYSASIQSGSSTTSSSCSAGGMVRGVSVLDSKETHILGFPLTIPQQIWILFLLPTLIQVIVYTMDLATDIAIGIQLLQEHQYLAGLATLIITYAPPLVLLMIRLTRPPDPVTCKTILAWILVEIGAFLFYPLRPLFCFGARTFWSIEALRHEDPEKEEALEEFEETKSHVIESYLFLQAFLQAGPQALLQIGFLVIGVSKNPHTEDMQALCIVFSLISLSMVTAHYHRYESQAKGGRKRVLGNASPSSNDFNSYQEDPLARAALGGSIKLPLKSRWTKAMAEDVPVGKLLLFTFWFMFLLGRFLCLALAANFFPVVVIGVCSVHYLIFFLYILPSPKFTASLPTKLFLPFLFIFCLVEVGVQFSKPGILYTLWYFVSVSENMGLTLIWALWGNWAHNFWFHYCLYLIGITHGMGLFFILIYIKFFRPKVKRLRPKSQELPEERPMFDPRATD